LLKRSWQGTDACSSSVAATLSSVTLPSASMTASRREPSANAASPKQPPVSMRLTMSPFRVTRTLPETTT